MWHEPNFIRLKYYFFVATSLIGNIFTPQKHTVKRQICVSGRSADLMLIRTPVARKPVIVPSLCWPQDIIGSMPLKRTETSLLSLYIYIYNFLFGRLNTNRQATDFMGHRLIASFLNSEMAVYCLLRFLLVLALNKCTFTTLIGNLFASKLQFIWSTLKSRVKLKVANDNWKHNLNTGLPCVTNLLN